MNAPSDYLVLDFESTGLPDRDLGFVAVHVASWAVGIVRDHDLVEVRQGLVALDPQREPMHPKAAAVNGLDYDTLRNHGTSGAQAVETICSIINDIDGDLPLVGQNLIAFDLPLLQSDLYYYRSKRASRDVMDREGAIYDTKLIWASGRPRPTLDPMASPRDNLKRIEADRKSSLDYIAEKLAVRGRETTHHDVVDDIRLTARVFKALDQAGIFARAYPGAFA